MELEKRETTNDPALQQLVLELEAAVRTLNILTLNPSTDKRLLQDQVNKVSSLVTKIEQLAV